MTPETAIHPTAQQRASARILPHPVVSPTMQSVVPRQVSSVAVPAERAPVIVALHAAATTAPQTGVEESASQPGEKFLVGRTNRASLGWPEL